jgi:hypothetical protein
MLEIIALIFLCKMNGTLALKKGLKPGSWKLYTIFAWLAAEITGIVLGISFLGFNKFDKKDIYSLMAIGFVSAFGGYLIVRAILEKRPDIIEEDINRIGVDDLQPPKQVRK